MAQHRVEFMQAAHFLQKCLPLGDLGLFGTLMFQIIDLQGQRLTVRQKFMQRRIQQTNGGWKPFHHLQNAVKIALLNRQKLC